MDSIESVDLVSNTFSDFEMNTQFRGNTERIELLYYRVHI